MSKQPQGVISENILFILLGDHGVFDPSPLEAGGISIGTEEDPFRTHPVDGVFNHQILTAGIAGGIYGNFGRRNGGAGCL